MNLKVRMKHTAFWIGLVGVILSAMGISPEMLTSWQAVGQAFYGLITKTYMNFCVIMGIIDVITDQTTAGIRDSKQALTYDKPKKD